MTKVPKSIHFLSFEMYIYLKKKGYERKIVCSSPDQTTNSETTNTNFYHFVLTNLNKFYMSCHCLFIKNNRIAVKNSGFVFSELVVGSGEQDIVSSFLSFFEHTFFGMGENS
mgnify:CR=1 FL=1